MERPDRVGPRQDSMNHGHRQHGLSVTSCTAEVALPLPMNHTRCYIVSLTGDRDDVVMALMFSDPRRQ
ncbi:MAG: hypothetical protein QOK33_5107 [Mycobacterium sp.]|jgi:hypothetical protein|nr:hypothetical protein [Mycobacterium sp.]